MVLMVLVVGLGYILWEVSSRSAASDFDDEEPLPQPEPAKPQQPHEEDVQPDNTQNPAQGAVEDFLSWLCKYWPQLAAYETCLRRDGWDTPQSLKLLTPEDIAQMNILPGHRRLTMETPKDLSLVLLGLVGRQPFFFWLARN